jgi:hypothetical protein
VAQQQQCFLRNHGSRVDVLITSSQQQRGGGRFFFVDIAKMYEFEQNFNVHKCNTLKPNKSHRLLTTVLVQSSHSHEIENIFLKTIATAASFQP